ncbi:MAG: hypothetical protein N0C82_17380 [Candidatus Thiodiazotropha endolucinida]|nr:hypothetical protein [Candidatus Thiodiazotropha taylori]MCW4297084.1 hypothetical protein [Candidatus Thiodiazotropha endolucinida]
MMVSKDALLALWVLLLADITHAGPLDLLQEKQQAPAIKPFELPTLDGTPANYNGYIDPLVKAPVIDADSVFHAAVACYPEKSLFDAEIALEGGVGTFNASGDTSTLGKTYVGIVGRLPLYSAKEHNREREREITRREKLSERVSELISAIAIRNHAIRESALYRKLEARSQVRVQKGLVDVSEQLAHMEKYLAAHKTYVEARAKITSARLAIVASCLSSKRPTLNKWLQQLTREP